MVETAASQAIKPVRALENRDEVAPESESSIVPAVAPDVLHGGHTIVNAEPAILRKALVQASQGDDRSETMDESAPASPAAIGLASAVTGTPAAAVNEVTERAMVTGTAPPPTRADAPERMAVVVDASAPAPASGGPGDATPPARSFTAHVAATEPAAQTKPAALPEPVITARPGQIGRELGVEISRRVSGGLDELTVRLNPEHLGRIEVKMRFDDGGALRAVVAADSPVALDLLRREVGDLGRSLSDAGVRADAQSFSFDSRGSGGDTSRFGSRHNPWNARADAGAAEPAGNDDHPVEYRMVRLSGRVDLIA